MKKTVSRLHPGIILLFLLPCAVIHGGQIRSPFDRMSVEELRAYQAFSYIPGGRDPMTVRFPPVPEPEAKPEPEAVPGPEAKPSVLPDSEEEEPAVPSPAEPAPAADELVKTEELATETRDAPQQAPPPDPEQLAREMREMEMRLKFHEEFEALPIRVDSLCWPDESRAIVNGRTVSVGDVMLQERPEGDLRLDIVEEDGVVFHFKDKWFWKPVEESSVDP